MQPMSLDVYTSDGANAGTVIDNARFHHSAWDRGYPHRHCGMPLGMYQILKLPSNGRNPQQGFEATIWYGPATSLHQDKIFQVCCRNQCLDATTGIKTHPWHKWSKTCNAGMDRASPGRRPLGLSTGPRGQARVLTAGRQHLERRMA